MTEKQTEVIKVEIAKLELEHGDTLVVKLLYVADPEALGQMGNHIRALIPEGVGLLVMHEDAEISIIKAPRDT